MCGIVGRVSTRAPVDRSAFERMTDRLAHRGPDGRGTWYAREGRVALGHRRLAILDLSPAGTQPMTIPGSGLWLTYNGEIYNHPALRAELEGKGHVYRSRCDSETILHAYAEWGTASVERLNGIFAFALWDEREGRLLAARDPIGVKPLYLIETAETLAFASQPGAFLDLPGFAARPDPEGMLDCLAYGVVPGERAAFAGVSKLGPGEALEWRDTGRRATTRRWRYWRLPERAEIVDPAQAARVLEEALDRAVVSQLASDVPVSIFLSGGIDSSLVGAVAAGHTGAPATAFTIGFDDAMHDERRHAALAADLIGAHPVVAVLAPGDLDAALDDVVEAYDEPFAIDAGLPMARLARLAHEHGVRVALAGDGADELFAGYRHYDTLDRHYRRHGRCTAERVENPVRGLVARALHGAFDPVEAYRAHNARITGPVAETLAGPALAEGVLPRRHRERAHFDPARPAVEAARRADVATYLADEILVKVDRATMAFGIEARVPLLDPDLAALAFRIDTALHYAGGERKALLKRVAGRWLPDSVLTVRKKGFSPPIDTWLTRPAVREAMLARVREGRLVADGILRRDDLARRLARLRRPAAGLLQLYLMERWAERWTGAAPATAPQAARVSA
ncbi:MAG: asparagine synthase (glutamine-hydrolyzing) [Paracoccaceae bacterium]